MNKSPIDNLLTDLQHDKPLIEVLSIGIRHACELTGCVAGVYTSDSDSITPQHWWIVHDPSSAIRHKTTEGQVFASSGTFFKSRLSSIQQHGRESDLRSYQVQLKSDNKAVGYIILWSNHEIDIKTLMSKLRPLDSLLALVGVALNGILSNKKLLDHNSFREHVSNEIERARRSKHNFSVIHIRMLYDRYAVGNESIKLWQNTITMGEMILSWLRKCDTLGVISPYRFSILLPTTTFLGAKIAARRIHHLLSLSSKETTTTQGIPQLLIVNYPKDANDVNKLCEITQWPNPLDSKTHLSGAMK